MSILGEIRVILNDRMSVVKYLRKLTKLVSPWCVLLEINVLNSNITGLDVKIPHRKIVKDYLTL